MRLLEVRLSFSLQHARLKVLMLMDVAKSLTLGGGGGGRGSSILTKFWREGRWGRLEKQFLRHYILILFLFNGRLFILIWLTFPYFFNLIPTKLFSNFV